VAGAGGRPTFPARALATGNVQSPTVVGRVDVMYG